MGVSARKPPKLKPEQQEQVIQTILNQVPHEVGLNSRYNWTLELIGMYIEREFGHSYSLRGVSKMLHRLGLSYTKPTHTLAAADKEKQKEFVEKTFPSLKKMQTGRN